MNFRPVIHRKYPKLPTYTNEFNGSGLVIRCIQCLINYLSIEPKSRQKNIMSTICAAQMKRSHRGINISTTKKKGWNS